MFCRDLKKQAMKIINMPQKPMTPLTDNKKEKHENSKQFYLCNKSFNSDKKVNILKLIKKLDIIVITHVNIEELPIVILI